MAEQVYRYAVDGVEFTVRKFPDGKWSLVGPSSKKAMGGLDVEGEPRRFCKVSTPAKAKAVLPKACAELGLKIPKGAVKWEAGIESADAKLDSKGKPKPAALDLKPSTDPDVKLRVSVPDAAVPILQEQMQLSHAIAKNRAAIGDAARKVDEAKAELKDRQERVAELEAKERDLFESMLDCQRDLEHGQSRLAFKAVEVKPKPAKKAAAKKKAAKKKTAAKKKKKTAKAPKPAPGK